MADGSTPSSSSRPWSQLPAEILSQLLQRINPNAEFTRFASVCKAWAAVAAEEPLPLRHQLPWLLLTEEDYPGSDGRTRSFYSRSEDKIHELPLPEARRRRCVGSTGGWLVTLGEAFEGEEMHVLNPVTRTRLPLPPQSTLALPLDEYEFPVALRARKFCMGGAGSEEEVAELTALMAEEEAAARDAGEVAEMAPAEKYQKFIRKVVLSCSPAEERSDCVAFAIYGPVCNKLAFARPGDAAWSVLNWDWEQFGSKWGSFEDAAYYKGRFYVVNCNGTVIRCRVPPAGSDEKPAVEVVAFGPPTDEWVWGNSRYLVEHRGELLQVLRRQWEEEKDGERRLLTDGFHIFRLNADDGAWDRVYTLGDHAVFLGMSTTVAALASNLRGCRRNCIYFTDDYDLDRWCSGRGGGCDTGYCTLVNRQVEFLEDVESYSHFSPPIWVFPSTR